MNNGRNDVFSQTTSRPVVKISLTRGLERSKSDSLNGWGSILVSKLLLSFINWTCISKVSERFSKTMPRPQERELKRSFDWSREGVSPLKLGKAEKIGIGRNQFTTMFNGQGCQVRVCNQIGDGPSISEHLLKYGPMSLGRSNDPCTGLLQPGLYTGKGLFKRKRVIENPRVGPYSNKCGKNRSTQTNNPGLGKLTVPPYSCFLVARMKRVLCIQKDVGIDEDQRESSPSIWASNSWMLSRLRPDRRPMA